MEYENKRYSYTGGDSNFFPLRVETTYEELLSRIYRIIKSQLKYCDIRVKVMYPCTNESIPPTVIVADDNIREFLIIHLEHLDKFIPLVIETTQYINGQHTWTMCLRIMAWNLNI
jgi:hypothetical protein